MKKYLLVVICLLLLVVTGCGKKDSKKDEPTPTPVPKNTVVCSGTISESGMNMKAEITAEFDSSDLLTDASVVYEMSDSTTANQYCSLFKLMQDSSKGITVSCDGNKITINGYAKIDVEDENDKGLIGATKEEFKKAMEEEAEGKVTCK